jgi:hypothetical protein
LSDANKCQRPSLEIPTAGAEIRDRALIALAVSGARHHLRDGSRCQSRGCWDFGVPPGGMATPTLSRWPDEFPLNPTLIDGSASCVPSSCHTGRDDAPRWATAAQPEVWRDRGQWRIDNSRPKAQRVNRLNRRAHRGTIVAKTRSR